MESKVLDQSPDNFEGEWIEPVATPNDLPVTSESNKNGIVASSTAADVSSEEPIHQPGTQSFSLINFRLLGQAGACVQLRLKPSLHCTRCRLNFDWTFAFRQMPPPTQPSLFSSRTQTANTQCARCAQPLRLVAERRLAHTGDSYLGTFYLSGCVVDDVVPNGCELELLCIECNRYIRISVSSVSSPSSLRCSVVLF